MNELTGWQLSTKRRIAHYIERDGMYFWAVCGLFWGWQTASSSQVAGEDIPKCKSCLRVLRAREAKAALKEAE